MYIAIVIFTVALIPVHCVFQNQPCQVSYFACDNGTVCIPRKLNCNGKNDCKDGSDEKDCVDRQKIEYWDNVYRKRPDEDREKMTKNCGLNDPPPECQCSEMSLFCTHRQLSAVPSPLPESLEELDVSYNQLENLHYDDFPMLKNLTILILSHSKLRNLSADVFQHMPSLDKVYLVHNLLATLQDDVFSTNSALRWLELTSNPLESLSVQTFRGLGNLEKLDLRNCRLRSLPNGVFDPLVNLNTLWLDYNYFVEFPRYGLVKLQHLRTLSFSDNKLQRINSDIFRNNTELLHLALSKNKLTYLTERSLGNITTLLKLDLSDNKIDSIGVASFNHLTALKSLDLQRNPINPSDLSQSTFEKLVSLEHIYFDDFQCCSYALTARVCHPQGDGISSAEHLLDKVILRVFVWIMAAVSCLGNLFVIVGRVLFKEPNEVHSFYIKNLSLADLLMGVYLFIIASYDIAFRGSYMKHQLDWRSSWQCQFCGFISTLGSEASVLVLTVITIDRYVSIRYPLASQRRNWSSAILYMIGAWTIALALASFPLFKLNYFGKEFYGNNGMCLPLHIHRPYARAWEYSTFMFCGINAAAFVLILYAYISMFLTISRSKSGLRSTQQQQDNAIVKRFAFIIGTDFICWVPIITTKLVAFADVDIPVDLYAWIAVFLLPVNSALNPVLYTLTTKLFKQHLSKLAHSLRPLNDFSSISFSSMFHHRSSKRSYFGTTSENDHSYSSRSSQLQSRKLSGSRNRNGSMPPPHPV